MVWRWLLARVVGTGQGQGIVLFLLASIFGITWVARQRVIIEPPPTPGFANLTGINAHPARRPA